LKNTSGTTIGAPWWEGEQGEKRQWVRVGNKKLIFRLSGGKPTWDQKTIRGVMFKDGGAAQTKIKGVTRTKYRWVAKTITPRTGTSQVNMGCREEKKKNGTQNKGHEERGDIFLQATGSENYRVGG